MYALLVAISTAIYTTVATIWQVEETLFSWMMSISLFTLGLICKPYLLLPLLAAGFVMVRRVLLRCGKPTKNRKSLGDNDSGSGYSRRYTHNTSSRGTESFSQEDSMEDTSQN
ncbi:uncharacterized protein LOC111073620 [Drosophila obscura]|uniref:uncharacterized protein LOC111073620 n=1 Tax=Drosophila obscura TaxID=7282 RepID=UPI001BB25BDA|nr:uncharacterized protein LOC111073620 [Drosophila obscura]